MFRKALLETKGLGPWSAEYISLRAIGDTDAFPRTDLILKRVIALHPDLDLEAVRPWRAYAAIHLWKEFAQTLSKQKNRQSARSISQSDEVEARKSHSEIYSEDVRSSAVRAARQRRRESLTKAP